MPCICNPLLRGKKTHVATEVDPGTWLIATRCPEQEGSQPCPDSQKNALCAIATTLPFFGGLPTEPGSKRPALDFVTWPTNSTSLRRAFTALD